VIIPRTRIVSLYQDLRAIYPNEKPEVLFQQVAQMIGFDASVIERVVTGTLVETEGGSAD
jgi:hypothetical protein